MEMRTLNIAIAIPKNTTQLDIICYDTYNQNIYILETYTIDKIQQDKDEYGQDDITSNT